MNVETFSLLILQWWKENKRILPWKNTKDAYIIWISEIILQQTRVEQGKPYYEKFISSFPDIQTLANATEDEVLKNWEGLGYYNRARNLHDTAKYLVRNRHGKLPDNYEELVQMKGIGPYTAAAIASFAFDKPNAVVDGNVIRLVTRLLGIIESVTIPSTLKRIQKFVTGAIQKVNPADFNQAIMDFGSLVCVPKNPVCTTCPLHLYCNAFHHDTVHIIPVKGRKKEKTQRYFHFYDITFGNDESIILKQRVNKDVWQKLYELPLIETLSGASPNQNCIEEKLKTIFVSEKIAILNYDMIHTDIQILTHQKIHGRFYKIRIITDSIEINHSHNLVERKKVLNFAFPKIITEYFNKVYNIDTF